jgi:hypothetical protein
LGQPLPNGRGSDWGSLLVHFYVAHPMRFPAETQRRRGSAENALDWCVGWHTEAEPYATICGWARESLREHLENYSE